MPLKAIFIKQTTSMTLKGEDPCTVKTFSYDIAKSGFHQRILFDVQIPLPENAQANDYLGHLIDRHNVPLFAHKEVANALGEFIWRETHQFMAAQADKQIQSGLDGDGIDNFAKQAFHLLEHDDESAVRKQFDAQSLDDTTTFEEHFQSVMRNCDFRQLSRLIGEEVKMSEEMRSLVQTRDSELSRLEKLCEVNLASSPKDAEKLDQHSQGISELNTQIRNVSADFSRQIETLLQKQRRHYRLLVQKLAQNESIDGKATELSTNDRQKPSTLLTSSHSHSAGFADDSSSRTEKGGSKTKFKKSMSCDERMSSLANLSTNYSESFSIYIGSQMKTMHNARILSCASLADLCLSQQDELHGSNRLHLLMSLYGRELSALVLIVGRDPRWHIRNRTRFAQLCEQGTELHFDRLETQLAKIEEQVRKANQCRRRRRQFVDLSQLSYSPPLEFYDSSADDGWLHTGDVYITRHSNLSAVQLVFHLVADTALGKEEVTSRHPCIGGLRNIVRLSARSAVRNISLPLLLVDGLKEKLATNHSWCLGRAELVYKCLKGFLMEVCSSGGSNASMTSGNSAAPAGSSQSLHFNINFALPSAVPAPLFRQLVDLFANIYYLVPSLNA